MNKKEMHKNSSTILLVVIIILALGFLIGSSLPQEISVYNTGEENLNLLSVKSTITKDFEPDRAEITFAVETLDDSAQTSQEKNAEITEKVMLALKNAGVKDSEIETMNYSVREEYEWDYKIEKRISKGFRTTNRIKVTLSNLDISGKVIDAAVNAGVNNVSNIAFTLSKEAQQNAKEIALKDASQYARVKANNIASGLGIVVGKVHSVSESTYYYTPNYYNYSMEYSVKSDSSAETPISPGDVSVSATVTVQFEI
jgi:uncharacterized protein